MPTIAISTRDYDVAMFRLSRSLSTRQLNRTTVRAINYALTKASTQFRRNARQQYNVNNATAKEITNVERATYTQPEGKIQGSTRPLSLSRFSPRFETVGGTVTIRSMKVFKRKRTANGFTGWKAGRTLAQVKTGKGKSASRRRKGVSIEVTKGDRKAISYAFLQNSMRNNGANGIATQIWARSKQKYSEGPFEPRFVRIAKSGNDNPIVPLKTTSPINILSNKKVIHPIERSASEDYSREFIRLATLALNGTL